MWGQSPETLEGSQACVGSLTRWVQVCQHAEGPHPLKKPLSHPLSL